MYLAVLENMYTATRMCFIPSEHNGETPLFGTPDPGPF